MSRPLVNFDKQVRLVRCTQTGDFYELVSSLSDALRMYNVQPAWWFTSADYRVLEPDVYIFTRKATDEADINWRATRITIDLQLADPQYEWVDDVAKCVGGDALFCRISSTPDDCVCDLDIDWFVQHAHGLYRMACPYLCISPRHTTTDSDIVRMIGEVPRDSAWQAEQLELWRLAARLRRQCSTRRWDMFSVSLHVVS